jgi:DNA-binding Lrp family transcriptional regulator
MLVVLETLAPVERAVFVLREVFDTPYDEIAETVGKSPVAVRQIAHRARQHVAMRRPRMQVDNATQRQVLERFMEAARTGEVDALLEVLAPDVVMVADGGGVAVAIRQPIHGAAKVAALLSGFGRQIDGLTATTISINGAPALVLQVPGEADTLLTVAIDEGRVTRIYAMRNPHKLTRINGETELAR